MPRQLDRPHQEEELQKEFEDEKSRKETDEEDDLLDMIDEALEITEGLARNYIQKGGE
jgi:ubiquitin-like protein Pup